MRQMNEIEIFTQNAYLETAAVRPDSKIYNSRSLAFVNCESCKEGWLNAVVRATQTPDRFNELRELINNFDRQQINFVWHLWSSSHKDLLSFLTQEMKLIKTGNADVLVKHLETPSFTSVDNEVAP